MLRPLFSTAAVCCMANFRPLLILATMTLLFSAMSRLKRRTEMFFLGDKECFLQDAALDRACHDQGVHKALMVGGENAGGIGRYIFKALHFKFEIQPRQGLEYPPAQAEHDDALGQLQVDFLPQYFLPVDVLPADAHLGIAQVLAQRKNIRKFRKPGIIELQAEGFFDKNQQLDLIKRVKPKVKIKVMPGLEGAFAV